MMKSDEFVRRLEDIARNHKTMYIRGCFGAPMTAANKKRYATNNAYNIGRAAKIYACSADTFGFDCICLVKAVLGLWDGSLGLSYGGTKVNKEAKGISYGPDRVPDVGADGVVSYLQGTSSDFSTIIPGELVWMKGHVGVYVGNGKVVECSPRWLNCVQYSNLGNTGNRFGNYRNWTKHGRLPWVEYNLTPEGEKPQDGAPAQPQTYHTVTKGDTLSKIAKAHGITLATLLRLNPQISNPNRIYPGDRIRVK